MRNFLWLGSKFIPAMYQGERMLGAASKIFSRTLLHLSVLPSTPAACGGRPHRRLADERRSKIKRSSPIPKMRRFPLGFQ
jgi:hypothetical protein